MWCPPPEACASPSKVAAVGVRAAGWVSYHGVALNVACDLAPFSAIVPCGIGDRPVGSVVSMLASRGGGGGSGGGGGRTGGPTPPAAPDPLVDECAGALLTATARVLGAALVAPGLAGGRIGDAAAAAEVELRAAAAAAAGE